MRAVIARTKTAGPQLKERAAAASATEPVKPVLHGLTRSYAPAGGSTDMEFRLRREVAPPPIDRKEATP